MRITRQMAHTLNAWQQRMATRRDRARVYDIAPWEGPQKSPEELEALRAENMKKVIEQWRRTSAISLYRKTLPGLPT